MRFDYPLNNVNTYETVGEFCKRQRLGLETGRQLVSMMGRERSTVILTGCL